MPKHRNIALLAISLALVACGGEMKLLTGGDSHELRTRPRGAPPNSPNHAGVLVLAFDGIDRELLYDMLRKGEMPALASLLGVDAQGAFPHAHFDETLLATLPSTTMAAWTTAFTGVGPAHHGVTGNEFFIREQRRFAAPAPATFSDHDPVLAIYTDQYLNRLSAAPSVYERMRKEDPNVLVWVAMQQLYTGADRFLLTKPTIVMEAFAAFFNELATEVVAQHESRDLYAKLDRQAVSVVIEALDDKVVPDVLTVYLCGTDLYAHVAKEGPDVARRAYLHDVVDEQIGLLAAKLRERHALDDRYVVVTSDHGHTEVVHDDVHALVASGDRSTSALLRKSGFRVRPLKLNVPETDDFQSVLAYQGALAYVYVADRSTCAHEKEPCNWSRPPRFTEDVLPVAEAFYKNNEDGSLVPALKGTLDMVLTRHPKPYAEVDLPFEVYVGSGNLVPIETYLVDHPHPTYVNFEARMRDLGVGPYGERAGDVILIAHNGDRDTPADRYYFAEPYHSWHGSPSRKDSDIPLIVAHPHASKSDLQTFVRTALGDQPHQQQITELLLGLRRLPRR